MSSKRFKSFIKSISSFRLSKTLFVGAIATALDLATLTVLVQIFGFKPQAANIPSLLVGSSTQFFGNRHVVFKAKSGALLRQMLAFAACELTALSLNALGYYTLVTWTSVHYVLARPIVSVVVFFGFSYQMWKLVFRIQNSKTGSAP